VTVALSPDRTTRSATTNARASSTALPRVGGGEHGDEDAEPERAAEF
jgi:hypothetical protein